MRSPLLPTLLSLAAALSVFAAPPAPPAPKQQPALRGALSAKADPAAAKRVEIVVERLRNNRPEAMDPNFVFAHGDLVRFKFKAGFNGYLYVMNQSSSGQYVLLFPKQDSGTQNRIEAGREYLVPMTDSGWFRIEPPAGHEIVYWLVSPIRLAEGPSSALSVPRLPAPAQSLNPAITPRCDDAIFRARGECLDNSAGLKAVPRGAPLPENLSAFSDLAGRELTMVKSNKAAAVSAPANSDEPFIYTLRLAHR